MDITVDLFKKNKYRISGIDGIVTIKKDVKDAHGAYKNDGHIVVLTNALDDKDLIVYQEGKKKELVIIPPSEKCTLVSDKSNWYLSSPNTTLSSVECSSHNNSNRKKCCCCC